MSDEPEQTTEETHTTYCVNELTHVQPIACKEASIYIDDKGEAAAWVQVYADILSKIDHHCLITRAMLRPSQLDDTLRIPYSAHLSRQEILEAEQETAIKPDQILTRTWPDLWGLPVYEITDMELDDHE